MLKPTTQGWMTSLRRQIAARIRYKVLGAAITVAATIGAIGWLGSYYVNAVARSVGIAMNQTAPLVDSALAASEAIRWLAGSARTIEGVCAADTAASEPAEGGGALDVRPAWQTEFQPIDELATAARSAGLEVPAKRLVDASNTLLTRMSDTIVICRNRGLIAGELKQKHDAALASIDQLLASVDEIALGLDGEMTLNEEHAKVALETEQDGGDAVQQLLSRTLLDTWPMLRTLFRLRERAVQLKEILIAREDLTQVRDVDAAHVLHAQALEAMDALSARVAPRLRAFGRMAQAATLTSDIAALRGQIDGKGALEDTQRRLWDLMGEGKRMEGGLHGAEELLSLEMRRLESEVRTLDDDAQAKMNGTIDEATLVISSVAGLAGIGTLLAALAFTGWLTRPIEALTLHARALQETQDIDRRLPASLADRPDEIGRLASSFNDMIAALADARRRLLEASRAEIKVQFGRLRAAIEGMPQGIYLLGPDQRLLLSNVRFAELYHLTEGQVAIGTHHNDIKAAAEANGAGPIAQVSEGRPSATGIRQSIQTLSDGRIMVVTTAPTSDGGAVVVHEDITERRRAEEKIAHMAHHDALTGLSNRVLFREQTHQSLMRRRAESNIALFYLDLDHFKLVNDTLGHPVGDRLLILASKRLTHCLREDDHIARLGGDEFAVVLNSNPSPAEAAALAERIIQSVGQPYDIDGQQVVIGVSVGIAMSPNDGEDADRLLKSADLALYRAKKEGRNTHCFFEPEMDVYLQERRELELALREAISAGTLQLYYQPLMNITSGKVEEFEALLRWPHPTRGMVPPDIFIPLAEETGLINDITSWVLKQACRDAAIWPDHIRVAVNISPVNFRARTLVLNVIAALDASGLRPDRLELEITEGILLHDTTATLETLEQLQNIGVRIAMDDFGTGYSSLSYLRKFNFDKVKIDGSFVRALDQGEDSRAIIRAVSGLCTTLGIEITAEGVETTAQLETLREEGCTQVQGYLFGRPAPVVSVASYLDEEAKPEPDAQTS